MGSNIEIRYLVGLSYERSCPGCTRISFDHIDIMVFDSKLEY